MVILKQYGYSRFPSPLFQRPSLAFARLLQRARVDQKRLKNRYGLQDYGAGEGNNVTLAPGVYVLAHDTSTYQAFGYTYIAKVKIEDGVFIGANAIILPGVTIGKNSIIGAGSVVSKNISADVVAAGNPAKVIGTREEFLEKHRAQMKTAPLFGEEYTLRQNVSSVMQQEMNKKMKNGDGYIK